MTTVVIDASVAVKWFVPEDRGDLADQLRSSAVRRLAPDIVMAEVATALSRRAREGSLPMADVRPLLRRLTPMFDEVIPFVGLVDLAVELSLSVRHPVIDCLYLALAQQRGCPLITDDAKFVAALGGTPHAGSAVALEAWTPSSPAA